MIEPIILAVMFISHDWLKTVGSGAYFPGKDHLDVKNRAHFRAVFEMTFETIEAMYPGQLLASKKIVEEMAWEHVQHHLAGGTDDPRRN